MPGTSVGGPMTRTRAPHGVQQVNVGARHAAVHDIAANRHGQALQPTLAPPDGDGVEQGLGRMLVGAVAAIDDHTFDLLRKQIDCAALRMAADQHVRVHGIQGKRGIEQRLALLDRTVLDRHIDDVGAKTQRRQLKRCAGARRILEKQIDYGPAAQRLAGSGRAAVALGIMVRPIEQQVDFFGRQPLDAQQVAVPEIELRFFQRSDH